MSKLATLAKYTVGLAAAGAVAHAAPSVTSLGPVRAALWPRLTGIGDRGHVALTFDDGPDPVWTPKILDVLKAEKVPATFFVIGENALTQRKLLLREIAEGHEVGSHTYTHPNLARASSAETALELNANQRLFQAYTGRSLRLFRAPYFGDAEPTTADEIVPVAAAQDRGYLDDVSAQALAFQLARQQVLTRALESEELSKQNGILKLQQALVGLNLRQAVTANDAKGLGGRWRDLLEHKQLAYTQQDAKDIIDRNSGDENAAFMRLAGRLIQQQDAAVSSPSAIRASVPEQGRLLTFTRAVAVDPMADLKISLKTSAIQTVSWSVRMLTLLATLTLVAGLTWAGSKTRNAERRTSNIER